MNKNYNIRIQSEEVVVQQSTRYQLTVAGSLSFFAQYFRDRMSNNRAGLFDFALRQAGCQADLERWEDLLTWSHIVRQRLQASNKHTICKGL
jgi:hypothetical protein